MTPDQSVAKTAAWTREFFPGSSNPGCSEAEGYTAQIFGMCAGDALGLSRRIMPPKFMEDLRVDQIDDVAMYYGLKKAAQYRRESFPEEELVHA